MAPSPTSTLVVDPGAHTIKAGLVARDANAPECHVSPNCMARSRTKHTYIGSSLSQCSDFGELQMRRPIERGYIVNWDLERAIFEHEFFDANAPLHCDPSATSLIITEPSNAPSNLSSNTDQIIFEEFSFTSALRLNGASLNTLNAFPSPTNSSRTSDPPSEIFLVVDAGHSSTTITPILRGRPINNAVRRISVGGKHITNYLAELISLRHFSLIDEPYIVSQIKEDACFVSTDFNADIERCWRGSRGDRRPIDENIVVDYVLPDYDKLHRGYMQSRKTARSKSPDHRDSAEPQNMDVDASPQIDDTGAEESFPLSNERFTPTELLFNPLDIGIRESGLPATLMQSLSCIPSKLWQGFLGNVLCVGGTSLLPGFIERLEAELRMLAPADIQVRVVRADDPITATWKGGARLAADEEALAKVLVSREEYLERGEGWVMRKFAGTKIVQSWEAQKVPV